MKKQYFIYSVITCMLVIFNVKAQNSPIDDFLKKYPSMEGVTNVSMSQQMLKSIFGSSPLNVPEAYGSVSVSNIVLPVNMFNDFKNTLLSSKYEQIMEVNEGNNNILCYFLKAVGKNTNEIVVLRRQEEVQFSAIYIKGNLEIKQLDQYLRSIQRALNRRMAAANTGIYLDNQFAFTMPSFDYNYLWTYKFDKEDFNFKMDEDFKLRMEESMKKAKEMMESGDFTLKMEESMKKAKEMMENNKLKMEESMKKVKDMMENEDFHRKINDAMKDVQKRIEDAQQQP